MDNTQAPALLSDRQREVLDRLDRRMTIKVIASELNISQTRVNQHIASLKRHFQANDLSELVAIYRGEKKSALPPSLRKPAYNNTHLPSRNSDRQNGPRVEGELALADVGAFAIEAPWAKPSEPVIVPGVLDGDHAVFRRLAAMLGLSVAIIAALVLTIAAATAVGDLLDGVADVPAEGSQNAG